MKFLYKKITPIVFALFFSGCNSNGPKPVAENFLKAMNQMDFDKAKTYGTEDTGKLLDMMSGFAKMIPDSSKKKQSKFEITGEKIDGDKATVTYREEGKEGEQTVPLIKVDGKWKVAMSKDSMNAAEGESTDTDEADSTSNPTRVHADSVAR